MKITIFSETITNPESLQCYPLTMNGTLVDFISKKHDVRLIEQGKDNNSDGSALTEEILKDTDVLIWWGHCFHGLVSDKVVDMVVDYVNRGMGMIALHSAHESKPIQRLLGTTGALSWREMGESERIWVVDRTHPIAKGIDKFIYIDHEEMYGEPFNIPTPDELVFISWFQGGEVMRSGCVFKRGLGKLFYFRPGHETLPTYLNKDVQKVILNAIKYVAPSLPIAKDRIKSVFCEPLEKLGN